MVQFVSYLRRVVCKLRQKTLYKAYIVSSAARSDKNVCKITTRRENGNAYHRVTALLIPRSGRQRPGFLAYLPPTGE